MNEKKKRLVQLGQELACIGIERETARRTLEELVAQGVSYTSEEMLQSLQCCQLTQARWTKTETEYLALRKEITKQ